MYILHYCIQESDFIFNEKITKEKKDEILSKYEMKIIGEIKEYWENNIRVRAYNNTLYFDNIKDKEIIYNKKEKLLIQEFSKEKIIPYSFYHMDSEEEYILYEKNDGNMIFQLKDYSDYITFQCICEKKKDINFQKIYI